MVPCRGLRTRGGYRRLKNELIRKRPDSPNMKDGELRPVLKQFRQNNDSDPDMDEPWTNYCKQYEKTVPIVWSAEAKDPSNFPFNENPGFFINIPENATPTYFLKLFLSDDLICFLVVETNRYAEKVLDEIIIKRNSRFKDWAPTDLDEMKLFLGLLIQLGMLNLPRLSDCWSTDPLLKTYTWRKTMCRNRFFLLLRLWHFEIPCANERLSKIAFFMNHLNETMKRIYCPSENLSLDESIVLWRGHLIFRQYIKNKKHKYGVKFYELCESS